MYEEFYGFTERPFSAVPRADRYFPGEAIEKARTTLVRCIERAEGSGLIVGPAGSGKSLLCQVLAEHFRDRLSTVVLSSVRMTSQRDLLQAILYELDLPYRGMQEGELRLSLIDHLTPGRTRYEAMLLAVDEAHSLSLKLFEELRLLTNLVRDGVPRVRLVLAGSSALEERFAHPKLVSFNQRLAARCYLDALTSEETLQFVRSQTAAAGGDPEACWTEDALRTIHRATGGVPRLINQVCDHALLLGAAGGVRNIDDRGIEEAWADLQQLPVCGTDEPAFQQTSGDSTVIEFGSLDDEEPSLEPAAPAGTTDDCQAVGELQDEYEQMEDPITVVNTLPTSPHDATCDEMHEQADHVEIRDADVNPLLDGDQDLPSNVEVDMTALDSSTAVDDGATANEIILRQYAGLEADNVVRLSPSMRPLSVSDVEEDEHDNDDAGNSADWQETLRTVIESRQMNRGDAYPDTEEPVCEKPLQITPDGPSADVHPTDIPSDTVHTQQYVTMSTVMADGPDVDSSQTDVDTPSIPLACQETGECAPECKLARGETPVEFTPTIDVRRDDALDTANMQTPLPNTADATVTEPEPAAPGSMTKVEAAADPKRSSEQDTDRMGEHPLIPVRPREYRQLFAKLRNKHAS